MKETLTKYQFTRRFREFSEGRFDQMGGYEGLGALFDYLERLEENCGTEIEFDPIVICCEYTVYENKEQAISDYSNIVETIEDLGDNTTVIPFGNDQLIVACF